MRPRRKKKSNGYRAGKTPRAKVTPVPVSAGAIDSINERKLAEAQLARANRAHRVLAECIHILVHAVNETEMLKSMCRGVVESGGYNQAWIGLPTGDPMRSVKPVAYAGYGSDAPMTAPATWTPDGRYKGVAADALASGETRIVRDLLNDPQHARMRERARQLGYQSSIALPLTGDGELIGVMVLHAAETDAFDADELTLLSEMTGDIGFGIAGMRARVAREQAEQRSRENERRLRETFEQAAVGIFHAAFDGRYLRVNRKLCEITGYTEEELTGPSRSNLSYPEDFDSGKEERKRLLSGEIVSHSNEKRYVRKDGKVIWVNRTESLARDTTGKPLYFIRVIEDITERKRVEEAIRESQRFLEKAQEVAHIGHWVSDPDRSGGKLQWSRETHRIFGLTEEQFDGRVETFFKLVHPKDQEAVTRASHAALAGSPTASITASSGPTEWCAGYMRKPTLPGAPMASRCG